MFYLQMKFVGLLLVAASTLCATDGANILGVFPINGRSHWVVYESLMKALAARGHNVTVITSFPQKSPVANYTEIDVSASFPNAVSKLDFDLVMKHLTSVFTNQKFIADLQLNLCRVSQKLPQVQALLKNDNKFDVVSMIYLFRLLYCTMYLPLTYVPYLLSLPQNTIDVKSRVL